MRDAITLATSYAAFVPLRVLKRAQRSYEAGRNERARLDAYFAEIAKFALRYAQKATRSWRVALSVRRRPAQVRARRSHRAIRVASSRATKNSDDDPGDPDASVPHPFDVTLHQRARDLLHARHARPHSIAVDPVVGSNHEVSL